MENEVLIVMKEAGITVEQALEAADQLAKLTPPISNADIALVRMNPSLNALQRWRAVKKIKKAIKERERLET